MQTKKSSARKPRSPSTTPPAPGSAYAGGSRVQQIATVEVWNETTQALEVESVTETTYLIDASNPTGYTQTLVERVYDGNGVLQKEHNYTLGHDVHGQSTLDAATQAVTAWFLLTDGHGSVRQLTNALAAVIQRYAYDAYGNMLTPTGYDGAATAKTNLLYSGESFNAATGLQYLRARYYDPAAGRFNRLDPFAGNPNDPQSLHKYLYTHGNPVMGVDPSGMFTMVELLSAQSIQKIIDSGVDKIGVALRIYNTAQKIIDVIDYAGFVIDIIRAMSQPTPGGAGNAIVGALKSKYNISDPGIILNGFNNALKTISKDWKEISESILLASGKIAAEVAVEFQGKLSGFVKSKAEGRLKLIFYMPTGPGARSKDIFIPLGDDVIAGVSASGGRLFGFGLQTSKAASGKSPIFRIDYWDVRKVGNPSKSNLHVHYHVGAGEDKHPSHATIWYKGMNK